MDNQKVEFPQVFTDALNKTKSARTTFDKLPPSHQREYLKYILEAKKPETRARRIQATVERLARDPKGFQRAGDTRRAV